MAKEYCTGEGREYAAMPQYQYNTDRKEANASAMSTSVIGKGIAGDAGTARESVVTGVRTTLLNRMKHANIASRIEANVLYQKSDRIIGHYNSELSSIAAAEETKQQLQEKIAEKEAEKKSFQATETYKSHERELNSSKKDYSEKKEAVFREKNMRRKQRNLPDKKALLMTHEKVLEEYRQQTVASKSSRKERKQAEERYALGLRDWEAERDEVNADQQALDEYKDASKEHLTKEYYKRIKKEQKDAKKRYKNASKEYKSDQAFIKTLTDEIERDTAELISVMTEQNNKKTALLDASVRDHADLTKETQEHQSKSAGYSRQHDKAAIQYYILARGKSAKKTGDVEIPGHSKDVSEYVGRPALSLQSLMHLFQNIKSNPGDTHKIIINNMTDAENPADEKHITHDKLISLTEGGQTYRMDSKYTVQPDASAGSAASGTNSPSESASPQKLKDLASLSINTTEAPITAKGPHRYIQSADTLALQTVATGSILHKQEVSGLWINGEFVPANGSHYESIADARKSYQKKMTAGGAFDQDDALALAIRTSPFFRHIYAENIEHYTRYPGDDDIDAVKLSEADPSLPAAPDLAVKAAFQQDDEDAKALTLFQYRNENLFNDLLADDSLYANAAKERVVAKLIHAMLALNKDRAKAIEIAQNHGSEDLKKAAQKATIKDYAPLFYACSTVIHGASASKFTFMDFLSGAEEFLNGDGPFLKGTVAEGLINYDQINDVYESIGNIYGFASGKIQYIQDLEDQMSGLAKDSEKFEALNLEKENAESDLEHAIGGDVAGLLGNVKDIIFSIVDICKMKHGLSGDNAAEKELGSRYISWMDYIFDIGKAILTPLDALVGLLSNSYIDVKNTSSVGEVVSIVKDMFETLENGYHLVQNARKAANITESMKTITSDVNLRIASGENPQVMYYLGRSRNRTGKDIAENAIGVVTGAANSAGDLFEKSGNIVVSKIITITTTAISTLGKLITNGIYNGKEKAAALKAAFGNNYEQYKKNPNFDRILKMTAGIKSLNHLAVVSRIFAAIDTHHLLKAAPSGSFEFNLAKTAMSAFYKPKKIGADPAKGGFDLLPFSAILKHVGEGDDWRSKLSAAIQ